MKDQRPSEVFSALPHTRPHRRSAKRAAPLPRTPLPRTGGDRVAAAPRPAVPRPAAPQQEPPRGTGLVGTAGQAVAELAEVSLSLSARALRGALARLPRP